MGDAQGRGVGLLDSSSVSIGMLEIDVNEGPCQASRAFFPSVVCCCCRALAHAACRKATRTCPQALNFHFSFHNQPSHTEYSFQASDKTLVKAARSSPGTTMAPHDGDGANTPIDLEDAGTTLPLLELPGEQRNQIYRYLFDDITTISGTFDVWAKTLPQYDRKLAAYSALVRTCKTVQQEASSIFLTEYLPRLMFYFNDLHTFYAVCGPAACASLKSTSAGFVLRSPTTLKSLPFGTATMKLMISKEFSVETLDPDLVPSLVSKMLLSAGPVLDISETATGGSSARMRVIDGRVNMLIQLPRILPKYPTLAICTQQPIEPLRDPPQLANKIEGRFSDLTWRGMEDFQDAALEVHRLADAWAWAMSNAPCRW